MKNKKIVIAGGTGFIGQALAAWFGKENAVTILTRQQNDTSKKGPNNRFGNKLLTAEDGYNIHYRYWDGLRVDTSWASAIDGADIVINLAGRSVNCRYTKANKQAIVDSRTDSTRAIGLAIRDAVTPPKVWINAGSATIYRHAADRPQNEMTGEMHDDFSVHVCKLWERTFDEQRTPFTRKIIFRTAVTLGEGGVMIPYFNLLKFGLGGHQGTGRQMYSWIYIDDLCRATEWVFMNGSCEGIYNLSSPNPIPNKTFMAALRKVTGARFGLPAFTWMLTIGAALIGTETELLLKSRWVIPSRLLQSGFSFKYATIEKAFEAIIAKTPRKKYHLF